MRRLYKINPTYSGDFINKIGEIVALMYVEGLDVDEIENIISTSPIIEELLEGNLGLISTLATSLASLVLYHEPGQPHSDVIPAILSRNRLAIKVHPMAWCGRVLAMYIIERECSMRQALDICSLSLLLKSFGQYHLVSEQLALKELFGLVEEEVC